MSGYTDHGVAGWLRWIPNIWLSYLLLHFQLRLNETWWSKVHMDFTKDVCGLIFPPCLYIVSVLSCLFDLSCPMWFPLFSFNLLPMSCSLAVIRKHGKWSSRFPVLHRGGLHDRRTSSCCFQCPEMMKQPTAFLMKCTCASGSVTTFVFYMNRENS